MLWSIKPWHGQVRFRESKAICSLCSRFSDVLIHTYCEFCRLRLFWDQDFHCSQQQQQQKYNVTPVTTTQRLVDTALTVVIEHVYSDSLITKMLNLVFKNIQSSLQSIHNDTTIIPSIRLTNSIPLHVYGCSPNFNELIKRINTLVLYENKDLDTTYWRLLDRYTQIIFKISIDLLKQQ